MAYSVLDISRYIINYSNEKGYGVSNLKLQKLLYFVQAYFLVIKNRKCFDNKIEAWAFGPVSPDAYHEFKEFGSTDIPSIDTYFKFNPKSKLNFDKIKFNDDIIFNKDKRAIDAVVDKFADYSATDLVKITHEQSPWIDAFEPYQNNEITIESMRNYFRG